MPAWLQAVLLGVVQGATEFIPISSSGHLVLVPYLAGWQKPGLAFDVALHLGTALAVMVFFRSELIAMARGLLGLDKGPDARLYRRLGWLVLLASVPVAIAGLALEPLVADAFQSPRAAALFLLLTAALLVLGERVRDRRVAAAAGGRERSGDPDRPVRRGSRGTGAVEVDEHTAVALPTGADEGDPLGRDLRGLGVRQALIVGMLQTIALLPGVSRSGTTITAGVCSGLTREAAARFSFLLSLPALLGAFALSLPDLAEPGPYSGAAITAAVVASFVSGYAAVRFLVRLVSRDRLTGFAVYCVVVSVVVLAASTVLGAPA